jgi:menaquinone-specific isochorismate synthase
MSVVNSNLKILNQDEFRPWDILTLAGENDFIYITPKYQLLGRNIKQKINLTPKNFDSRSNLTNSLKNLTPLDGRLSRNDNYKFLIEPLPIAFMPLQYQIGNPSEVFIPSELIYLETSGIGWQLTIDDNLSDLDDLYDSSKHTYTKSPDEFCLKSSTDFDKFKYAISEIVQDISAKKISKVVLARRVEIEANIEFSKVSALQRLKALYPSCTLFSMDGFIGASPELLLKKTFDQIFLKPLAGTIGSSGTQQGDLKAIDELTNSDKNQLEHSLVVKWLLDKLGPICSEVKVSDKPEILTLRNVIHLATSIEATLFDNNLTLLELIATIHPTPAVGGVPDETFSQYQYKYELYDRGRYAGPIGWINSDGNGEFYLGIRSAQVSQNRATIWAGVGIVAHSDPESELIETQLKLQAMLSCLVRP